MSALLHALNDLNLLSLHLKPKLPVAAMGEEDEEVMPYTSLPRAWAYQVRKEKTAPLKYPVLFLRNMIMPDQVKKGKAY